LGGELDSQADQFEAEREREHTRERERETAKREWKDTE
jgi:hypothetical protein